MRTVRQAVKSQAEGVGTLFSIGVFLLFNNEIGVPELPPIAFIFAVLLYIGGLVTGYGFSLESPE